MGVHITPSDGASIRAGDTNAPSDRRTERWVLVATILGSSLSFIDGTVVNVALPTIQRELHASVADVQWVVEAYALFLAALLLAGGALGDRFGRRRVFTTGIIIFTVASVVCGLAPNILVLIVARAVQGVGGALLVPGSLAIIGASFDASRRGAAIGAWSALTTITTALGPVLGGWLVQTVSWRLVFYINAPLAALTLVVTFRHVRESCGADAHAGRLDWAGAGLATLGLGAVVFGLVQSSVLGLGSPVVALSLAVGAAALVAFVLVETRLERAGHHPMVPPSIFRVRSFSGANILTLLLYGALGGALYFLPFNLQQVQGYSAAQAGAAFLPFTVIVFVLSRWAGGLVSRVGAKLPLIVGPAVAACGFALFAVPGIGGSYWLTFFPAVFTLSLGMALVIAPLTTAVMSALGQERSGVASGANNAASRTAGLLAIAIMNLIVVAVFSHAFDGGIAALHLSPAVNQALASQRTHLAAATAPAGVSGATRAAIHHVVAQSFVAGFRVAMLLGAALALLSSVVAAATIEGKSPREEVGERASPRASETRPSATTPS